MIIKVNFLHSIYFANCSLSRQSYPKGTPKFSSHGKQYCAA